MSNKNKDIRNRTLVITEGNHEKEKLLRKLLLVFPYINIDFENIIIYKSNIYNLYNKIVKDYGDDWEDQEVDLPMSISQWNNFDNELSKDNFTNILLIFDYERHDPYYSKEIICKLQKYFSDVTDVGQLYLNYPMVESYLDFDYLDYSDFKTKKFVVDIRKGKEYKNIVSKTKIFKVFNVFDKIIDILDSELNNEELSYELTINILRIKDETNLINNITSILSDYIKQDISTLSNHIKAILTSLEYLKKNIDYFEYLHNIFKKIIQINLQKAYFIQNGNEVLSFYDLKDIYFEDINLFDILCVQNCMSDDVKTGFIWVLNTSIFIAANYKAFWLN